MSLDKRTIIKSLPFLLIGIFLFILYVYFFVDLADTAALILRADLFFYSLGVLALIMDMAFYSLAWQYLMLSLSINCSFKKTFMYVGVGTFVDLLVPAESVTGEVSKAYLMSRNSDANPGKVVASIVSHRILSISVTLFSLIAGSILLVLKYETPPAYVQNLMVIIVIGTLITLFFLFFVVASEKTTEKVIYSAISLFEFVSRGRWRLNNLRSKAKEGVKMFHQGIRTLGKRPSKLVWPVVFSAVSYIFNLLISFLSFASLGIPIHFSVLLVVNAIIGSIQSIPLGVPGEVGLTEIVMTSLYALFGVPLSVSTAVTLLGRSITLGFRLIVGFIAVQWVALWKRAQREDHTSL